MSDHGVDRTLPHNLEAERAVLGAILLHNDAFEVAAAILRPEDFFRDAHRRIFATMIKLLDWRDGSVDFLTIKDQLAKQGDLDEVGGPAALSALADGVPRSTNIEHYARIVFEKAQLRRLIAVGNKLVTESYDAATPAAAILAEVDKRFVDLMAGQRSSRTSALRQTAAALMQDMEHRYQHRGELSGVDTGFQSINELTLGWQKGDLIVLGARPSVGKTTFALNSAVAAARSGKRVAFFSLEMRRQQLEYRILSSMAQVSLSAILGGHVLGDEWARLSTALGDMQDLPLFINDQAGLTIGDVRAECRRLRSEQGVDLVVVDYVQLMAGMLGQKATRNEQIGDTSTRAKTLADEIGAPVILLSQLSRASEKRSDPRPKLSDLRESGALEQDADIVGFLHRTNHRLGGLTYWIAEKQRQGATGTRKLSLNRDTVTFTDAPELGEPASAASSAPPEQNFLNDD